MAYTNEQRRVINTIISEGRRRRVPDKGILSAISTGIVEQSLRHQPGGGGTSSGWRQETSGSYGNVNRMDLKASVNRYYDEISPILRRNPGISAGDLAAAVQRPAAQYRGRYAQHLSEAQSILKQFSQGQSAVSEAQTRMTGTTTKTTPGGTDYGSLITDELLSHSARPEGSSLLKGIMAREASGAYTIAPTTTVTQTPASAGASAGAPSGAAGPGNMPKGAASWGGKKVAAWMVPILDYAKAHGWRGGINSGYRSYQDQVRVCATGVKPCAAPGTSRHQGLNYPGGAIDVSDPEGLNRILQRSPYKGRLTWAGSKDPPHFSHPSGGGY